MRHPAHLGRAVRPLLLLALVACRADEPPERPPPSEVRVAEAAVLLDAATAEALVELSDDRTSLVFEGSTALLDALEPGDVLVAGIHPTLPEGLLRSVLAVERDGARTTVVAGPAGLTDVIEAGSLSAVLDLSAAALGERLGPDALVVGFNEEVVFDADLDPATDFDQVRVDGSVAIDPELVLDIDISGFSLQRATVELQTDLDAYLTVDADRLASVDERFVLQTIAFEPVMVFIGPIPVVFTPELELAVDLRGTVTARMRDTLQVETHASIGFGYDGGFGPIVDLDPQATLDVASFEPGGTEAFRVGLDARYDVAAYGMAGVYVGLGPYARWEVDTLGDPWWTVWAGVEGRAGAYAELDVDFFFFDVHVDIFDYETDPLGFEELVATADGGAPPLEDVVDELTWARSYGRDASDHPIALLALDDGGTMVAGGTLSFSPTPEDALLVRLDRLGNVAWAEVFDDVGPATSVVEGLAGTWVVAGAVGGGADRATLFFLDPNGAVAWAQGLEAPLGLAPHQLVADGLGGVYVGGAHGAFDEADAWVAHLGPDGDVDWSLTLGDAREDRVMAMAAVPGGGVWVAVSTHAPALTFSGILVAELGPDGAVRWQRRIDGDGLETPKALVPMPSGDLVVVGDDGVDALAVRLDPQGVPRWARLIDSGGDADNAVGAALADTDRVLVAGKTGLGDDTDLWAFRVDADGNVDWARSYGGPRFDAAGGEGAYASVGQPVAASKEGGFYLAGTSDSFAPEWPDLWVLRVGETGYVDLSEDPEAVQRNVAATVDDLAWVDGDPGLVAAERALTSVEVQPLARSVELDGAVQGRP